MMMCSTPTAPQRTDCVAGHVGLELANVVSKKPLNVGRIIIGLRDQRLFACGLLAD